VSVHCPRDYDALEVKANYYAMIMLIDDQLRRIVDALRDTGQLENTIIVFMSDHGELLGDHGLILKGCRFFEGLVRVPLILSWPGHFDHGVASDALVEAIDVAPTPPLAPTTQMQRLLVVESKRRLAARAAA
jgi:arylsulfatase A-like enzyme